MTAYKDEDQRIKGLLVVLTSEEIAVKEGQGYFPPFSMGV